MSVDPGQTFVPSLPMAFAVLAGLDLTGDFHVDGFFVTTSRFSSSSSSSGSSSNSSIVLSFSLGGVLGFDPRVFEFSY
jgi:hypothetical protein